MATSPSPSALGASTLIDPATGKLLPSAMLSVRQIAKLWPCDYETARKRIAKGDWVDYQQDGDRAQIHVPDHEFVRVRKAALKKREGQGHTAKRSAKRKSS